MQRPLVLGVAIAAAAALLAGCGNNAADGPPTGPSASSAPTTSIRATPTASETFESAAASEAAPVSGASAESEAPPSSEPRTALDCPVDDQVIRAVIIAEIVAIDPALGGVGGSEGYGFAYAGCRYTTVDGSEFTVADIVDENGDHTVAPIVAMGDAGDAGPDVGDEAFFTRRDALVVRAQDRSFSFEVDGAQLDEADRPLMVTMARGVVSSDADDLGAWCKTLVANVPDRWEPTNTDRPQQGEGTSGGVGYLSCRVTIATVQGASVQLKISEGSDMFDEIAADEAGFDDRAPQAVAGLGDEAYRYGDGEHLLVRVGDRGIVLVGQDSSGNPAGQDVVAALAAAVLDEA